MDRFFFVGLFGTVSFCIVVVVVDTLSSLVCFMFPSLEFCYSVAVCCSVVVLSLSAAAMLLSLLSGIGV